MQVDVGKELGGNIAKGQTHFPVGSQPQVEAIDDLVDEVQQLLVSDLPADQLLEECVVDGIKKTANVHFEAKARLGSVSADFSNPPAQLLHTEVGPLALLAGEAMEREPRAKNRDQSFVNKVVDEAVF